MIFHPDQRHPDGETLSPNCKKNRSIENGRAAQRKEIWPAGLGSLAE
jgi:hypothetical protein